MRNSVSYKIAGLAVGLAVATGAIAMGVFVLERPVLEDAFDETNRTFAISLGDTIDRNLFERYGDVQAFGLNGLAHDPANHGVAGPGNPLVAAMDGYMANYGLYRMMMLVGTDGRVLAVNSRDGKGKPMRTEALLGADMSDQTWFKNALAGRFLDGSGGLTGTVVEAPHYDAVVASVMGDDGLVLTYAAPVKRPDGSAVGVWVNFADFGLVEQIASDYRASLAAKYQEFHLEITDATGRILVDMETTEGANYPAYVRDTDVILKANVLDESGLVVPELPAVGSIISNDPETGESYNVAFARTDGAYGYPGMDWLVSIRQPGRVGYPAIDAYQASLLWSLGAGALVMLALGLVFGNLVARPIQVAAGALTALAAGRATGLPYGRRTDEIGDMARAYAELESTVVTAFNLKQVVEEMPVAVMTADVRNGMVIDYVNPALMKVLKPIESAIKVPLDRLRGSSMDVFHRNPAAQQRTMADPKNLPIVTKIRIGSNIFRLRVSAIRDRAGVYTHAMVTWVDISREERLANEFDRDVKGIVDAVSLAARQIGGNTDALTAVVESATGKAAAVRGAAETTATSVHAVAASSEELLASISEITRQVTTARDVSDRAVQQAEQSDVIVRGLTDSAQRIGEVVGLISGIAEKTNLLALNATIEAARAGEAGRGFAIVAQEVKNLATQTSRATDDIVAQVQAIQGASGKAAESIRSITGVIREISSISAIIASAVEEQSAATEEITSNIQRSSTSTGEVTEDIVDVEGAIVETNRATIDMRATTRDLAELSGRLQQAVNGFLKGLEAA
jgi:methyl-accepting chemotaxis protein